MEAVCSRPQGLGLPAPGLRGSSELTVPCGRPKARACAEQTSASLVRQCCWAPSPKRSGLPSCLPLGFPLLSLDAPQMGRLSSEMEQLGFAGHLRHEWLLDTLHCWTMTLVHFQVSFSWWAVSPE